jgi:hypothetical protein
MTDFTPGDTQSRFANKGGLNDQLSSEYGVFNSDTQTDFNAAAHAYTSAGVSLAWGNTIAAGAGVLREMFLSGDSTLQDSVRDIFNNGVGRRIGEYARKNDIPESELDEIVVDALERGLLMLNEATDPRLNEIGPDFYGAPIGVYDGPSPELARLLEHRLGLPRGSLDSGSATGPVHRQLSDAPLTSPRPMPMPERSFPNDSDPNGISDQIDEILNNGRPLESEQEISYSNTGSPINILVVPGSGPVTGPIRGPIPPRGYGTVGSGFGGNGSDNDDDDSSYSNSGSTSGGSGGSGGGSGGSGNVGGGGGTGGPGNVGGGGSGGSGNVGGGGGTGGPGNVGGGGSGSTNTGNNPGNPNAPGYNDRYDPDDDPNFAMSPILLDLDGDGVQITELNRSTRFVDGGEGLLHRTAWAAAGNGVLFFDPDGRNAITEKRQYVFTEWNPTASGDLEALRSVWDSNGDGKLTAADTEFAKFKVLVTNADGTTTVQTLTQLGITEINLTADTTYIERLDGSVITGHPTFARGNGTTGTVANTTLRAA